jgi:transposase, IS5 family
MLTTTQQIIKKRLEKLDESGNPLLRLEEMMDWQIFMPTLERTFAKEKKSKAGRKSYPLLLMFKILILQNLYNLSDYQTEYQIRDRLSFTRFLGLRMQDTVPDEKTIWVFKEALIKANAIEKLFNKFNEYLGLKGYSAALGTIIDASIVASPKQRNSRDENKIIKEGGIPESFKENQNVLRQKDVDARWTKKNNQNYYGYKNHISIDVKHKIIRSFEITSANVSDINCFDILLESNKQDKKVWADSAYFSAEKEEQLQRDGYESRIISRNKKHLALWSDKARENTRRAKIRGRIEHVFGFINNTMRTNLVHTIGHTRTKAKLGLVNLVYNLCRFEQLERLGIA